MKYNRLNPLHWLLALFSNSRKSDYLKEGTLHVEDGYKATQRILYWLRNPAHDFMHYIIGFVDDPEYQTIYGEPTEALKPGWIFAIRKWRWLFMPYVAYQGCIQFYLGWRPYGGLGFKLRKTPVV